jgi:hypothetical protein
MYFEMRDATNPERLPEVETSVFLNDVVEEPVIEIFLDEPINTPDSPVDICSPRLVMTPEEALKLWRELGQSIQALSGFVSVWNDGMLAGDLGERLTCSEVEALAEVFEFAGSEDGAQTWLDAHAEGDDEGDSHYGYVLHYISQDVPDHGGEPLPTWSVYKERYRKQEDEVPIDGTQEHISSHPDEATAQQEASRLQEEAN